METLLHNMFYLVSQSVDMSQPMLTWSMVLEKIGRSLIVYVFLILALRLGGKRELSQLNPFDLVLLLLLSNAVQNAIIGSETSVTGGIIGASTLLVTNYLIVRFLYNRTWLDRFMEGKSELLISKGKIQMKIMKKELITVEELTRAAHKQGLASLEEVEEATLDAEGGIGFIAREPSPEERRHQELIRRIDNLEKTMRALKPGGGE